MTGNHHIPCLVAVAVMMSTVSAVSSILAHCRLEQAAHCFNRDDAVPCLMSNRHEMMDGSTCKAWLVARHECFESVARSSMCTTAETKLQCLVRLPLDEISLLCSESAYFNTVKQDAALFAHQNS